MKNNLKIIDFKLRKMGKFFFSRLKAALIVCKRRLHRHKSNDIFYFNKVIETFILEGEADVRLVYDMTTIKEVEGPLPGLRTRDLRTCLAR